MLRKKISICVCLILLITIFTGCTSGTGETEVEYDPSDIWQYDFAGDYYRVTDDSLADLSKYEQMVTVKNEGSYYVSQDYGGFTLTDEYSGYWYGRYDKAVTVDIDRDNRTMKLIESTGYVEGEYSIEWCEETQEWYFIEEDTLHDGEFDRYWFKLDDVAE